MTSALFRAIVGVVVPNRGDVQDIPQPYRTTVMQARALMKLKGSPVGEPGKVVTPPIPEEPTP